MIRKYSISVFKFIRQYIMPESRLPNRYKWFEVGAYPLKILAEQWKLIRDDAIIRANVTYSEGSLEWYLNYKYDPVQKRIYLGTAGASGVNVGLNAPESADYLEVGLPDIEPAYHPQIPLPGEDSVYNGYSFGVFVPADLMASQDDIAGVARIYAAINDFIIIQQ